MLAIYEELKKESLPKDVRATDVLRACVIFLHGSQEDYIRSILIRWLPSQASRSALDGIALVGTEGRSSKYSIQDLLPLRDRGVKEVIEASVEQAMQRQTFNNYSEIIFWIRKLNINLDSFKKQKEIDEMTSRRHQIVHRVDFSQTGKGDGHGKLVGIQVKTVEKWKDASVELIELIEEQIAEWIPLSVGREDESAIG